MQCSKCRNMAVVFQEYSGQYLCRHHFDADVEAKAKHEIRRNHWMTSGDHIAVALSGDAVSSALLYFLKKLVSNRHDIRISAIVVDEGILGFHRQECALQIAEQLETECCIGSFRERFGKTLDDITRTQGRTNSCTCCRVLRNFLLNQIAIDHGITKLAYGDTLDQGAVSVLKNILKGYPEILVHREKGDRQGVLPIRPFLSVPRKELIVYAGLHVKGYDQSHCPYSDSPFDRDTRIMLNEFTVRHPATKYALMSLEKNMAGSCSAMTESISACRRCGQMYDGICQTCRIIDEVTSYGT